MLAAAGAIAFVSAITFGLLLNALLEQQRVAGPGRATSDARYAIAGVQKLTLDLETGVRGYLLTGDRGFLAPYDEGRKQLPPRLAALAKIPNDATQRARIARLRQAEDAYMAYLSRAVAGDDASAAIAQEGKRRFDAISRMLETLDASELAELTQIRTRTADLRRRAIVTASVGLAALLILIGLLSYGAVRAVVTPVANLQAFARELGARRYGARLPESGPPETVELAQAFNATAVSLEAAEAELRRIGERHLAELDAVFREAPLGLAFVDRELRFLRVNEELARMNRRPAAEHLGRDVEIPEVRTALLEVIETGEPILDREMTLFERQLLVSYYPVRDGGDDLLAVGAAVTDITERRRAEAARERLQHVTAALAAAVTVTDVARATVDEARAAFESESAALLVLEAERLELRAFDALSEDGQRRLALVPLHEPRPVAAAARTGEPVFVCDEAEMAERFPALAGWVPAVAVMPLIASGATVGVLMIDFEHPRELAADERDLLDALAGQSAVALARAQLYEREHAVAQTLQASLLPRDLPKIPGLDLYAELRAGATGIDVGGDFYDVFAISEGVWGFAIGDVCGKGVDAAALTALARHTVRAAAQDRPSPSAVLTALNRAVLAESRTGQFLTAIFGRIEGRRLTMACGGHPPPVLLAADGTMKGLECTGTLLGVLDDPQVSDTSVSLEPGDTLLLYTDGLTEAGAPASTLTTEDVAELLRQARADSAYGTVQRCLARALEDGGGVIRDDVAVLVANVSTEGRSTAGESSTRGQ